jgi:ribosomal protein S18 acetylase RimI-like enzyme
LNYYPTNDYSYLKQRADAHQLWVGLSNETVIGFIGIHDEGSIGLLYVRPEYRKMGYGEFLQILLLIIF